MKKHIVIFFVFLLLFTSCEDADAPRDDETNRYYADLLKIHKDYATAGNEATLVALDAYLEEFPELPDAYLFKGYILGSMGKTEEAYKVFDLALASDSNKIECYEQYSSFLIYDTLNREKCEDILNLGLMLSDSSSVLYNNFAWFELLRGNVDYAIAQVNNGLNLNINKANLTRTLYVASLVKNEEALLEESKNAMIIEGYDNEEIIMIDSLVQTGGPYDFLKTLLQ